MQNKTALIVDDSRTACQVLRLMLEREEFQVDVLDNPEQALGYLRDHRPGVIFMDHLMPGMEGFNAVKEIKSNSLAAQIPIVMYTAKSGDLYVGQAQALGAVDILPKPPTRELLRAVFRRIDQRSGAANDPVAAPVESAPSPESAGPAEGFMSATRSEISEPEDAPAAKAVTPAVAPPLFVDSTPAEDERVGPGWPAALMVAALAAVLGFLGGSRQAGPADASDAYPEVLSWALSQTMQYPYGEAPFGGERVELIGGLVERLRQAGFSGTLKLRGHAGQFCLVASTGGWRVADAATPIGNCDVKGFFNKQDARLASARQSAEFRALLGSPAVAGSGIRIQIEGLGDEGRSAGYPTPENVSTAGEWNAVAARNNRISVSLVPDA
jgi:CheY-like chemotaxis protein